MNIRTKLSIGFGFLISATALLGYFSYQSIAEINQRIIQLVEVEEPLEEATLEMEINAGETVRAVLDYVMDRESEDRLNVLDSAAEFERYEVIFLKLAESDEEKRLGLEVATLYLDFKIIGDEIMDLADRQYASLVAMRKDVKAINALIEVKILLSIDRSKSYAIDKLEAALDMEINIDEAYAAVEAYLVERDPLLRDEVHDAEADFERFEALYRKTPLSIDEVNWINQIDRDFADAKVSGDEIMDIEDQKHALLVKFQSLLVQIDAILDDQIYPLIHAETVRAAQDAAQTAQEIQTTIITITLLSLMVGVIIALGITRSIVNPVNKLKTAVIAIGMGKLDTKIDIQSKGGGRWQEDEIGLLGSAFKKMAVSLQQSATERSQAELELRIAKEAAEEANNAKSEFLSSMSHELRTPMNAVLGFAEMLHINSSEPLSEKQKSFVDHILKGGKHLMVLIDDVLELSKIEAGELSVNFNYIGTGEIIDESLELIQARAQQEGIEILDQIPRGELPILWTDGTRLTQALLNLLSNAVKYNRKHGTVTLSCEEAPNQMLRISVADTGVGIPEEKQRDLFKSFARLGREAGEIEGTGIGLTITRRLVELLGGEVSYQSEVGKGSTFWIDVPISHKHAPAIKKSRPSKKTTWKAELKAKDNATRTILYIEDSPDNMQLMTSIITHVDNTKLMTADHAELGLDLATKIIPDLILMDLNLPGMNGFEALKRLQDTAQTQDIPVIAITAAALPKDIEKGLKAGFKDYIIKPFSVGTCIRIIEEMLDSIEISD